MLKMEPAPERTMAETYHFRLELCADDGSIVEQRPLTPADFSRAIYATTFEAFRAGALDRYAPDLDRTRIEPKFPAGDGSVSACTAGFRVEVPAAAGSHSLDFDLGYFKSRANALRAEMVKTRNFPADKTVSFQLTAYLEEIERPARSATGLALEPLAMRVPIHAGHLSDFGSAEPWDGPSGANIPVLIGRSLLQEAVDEARQAAGKEIGGLMLGALRRDPMTGTVFLVATCLVSGAGTNDATATSVTFTPETFARAREMISLRARANEAEIIAGWYHSHPFRVCDACPWPMPSECVQKILFYSPDDIHLMESTFEQPYMIGLLAAVEPRLEQSLGHLPVRLFGWKDGQIQTRGFDVIEA